MEKNMGLRVVKNTGSLYIRTIVLTIISLFSVRVVLNALGASDYGIYNVVGGFITMFGFISGSLSNSTQRYFAIHLASDDWDSVNRIFSVNFVIYLAFVATLFLVAETIGNWFVFTQLNYDRTRTTAAMIVYQTSVVSFLIGILVSPFLALLIADENLSIYSMMSIVESVLKLCVVYFLYIAKGDKLIVYALLMMCSTCIVNFTYIAYVKRKYKKLRFRFCKDRDAYRGVFSYLNWNLIGSFAAVIKGQGINIIINIVFGTTINTARGVASQVSNIIASFSQNFMKALDPNITKAYALGDKDGFRKIIDIASKISFSLLFVIAMPFIFNIDYVLKLWLHEVPNYTAIFTVLVLVDALVSSVTNPILTGVQATGKVKLYQIVVGGMSLLNLPMSYILLKIIENPLIPFFVAIAISVCMGVGRMIVFRKVYDFHIGRYVAQVIIPMLLVSMISSFAVKIWAGDANSFLELVKNVLISLAINLPLLYTIGLSRDEKKMAISIIRKKITR